MPGGPLEGRSVHNGTGGAEGFFLFLFFFVHAASWISVPQPGITGIKPKPKPQPHPTPVAEEVPGIEFWGQKWFPPPHPAHPAGKSQPSQIPSQLEPFHEPLVEFCPPPLHAKHHIAQKMHLFSPGKPGEGQKEEKWGVSEKRDKAVASWFFILSGCFMPTRGEKIIIWCLHCLRDHHSPLSLSESGSGSCKSCPTLRNPVDCSPPGSSVHEILQARTLEWLPFPSPGDLPNPGIKPKSPALQADSLPPELPGKLLLKTTVSEKSLRFSPLLWT